VNASTVNVLWKMDMSVMRRKTAVRLENGKNGQNALSLAVKERDTGTEPSNLVTARTRLLLRNMTATHKNVHVSLMELSGDQMIQLMMNADTASVLWENSLVKPRISQSHGLLTVTQPATAPLRVVRRSVSTPPDNVMSTQPNVTMRLIILKMIQMIHAARFAFQE